MRRLLGRMNLRLAYNPGPINAYKALSMTEDEMMNLRLAYHPPHFREENGMKILLAHTPGAQGDNILKGEKGVEQIKDQLPALLVSYVYLDAFIKHQDEYAYRDWVLDSGAYSAYNSGTPIDLQKYMDQCKQLIANDPTLTEVFALDVIGDWKASLKNTEKMHAVGIPAIPCFHIGEPWSVFKGLCADYDKVAIGGVAKEKTGVKMKFAEQCFARGWPKKLHGFGYGSEKTILAFPWHSVDATNWEIGPCKYGRWNAFGGKLSVRGSKQNLRAEVEYYLALENKAQQIWKKQMALLGADDDKPAVQLGLQVGTGDERAAGLTKKGRKKK